MPSEVRTSQVSLNPRYNESNHPEEDDVISDDEKNPEEIAAAELRANRRRGYDPNSSLDENNTSFISGVGSSVSSTPSLERAIKKKKILSESDSDDLSSTQQVVVFANPLPQQSSFTKTLVERWYSSVLLI